MPVTFTFGEWLSARSVIGSTLAELGGEYDNLWTITPEIGATLGEFRALYPDRFLDVGIAEQVSIGVAAGLAYEGNIPVVSGMLPFLSMRALEQIRSDVCYPNLPVKIIGTHGGLVGNGGSTHYAVEDLALMCALTNMTVTSIADPLMAGDILRQSMKMSGPIYIRLGVGKSDMVLYEPGQHDIQIGKGIVARDGYDATIFTHGTTVAQALEAAETLGALGHSIRVIDMFTLKPIDADLIERCAKETGGRFVVLEDHLAYGGLASRVADVLADRNIHLTAFERLGIPQVYAGFGGDEELRDKYGYGLTSTISAIMRVLAAK
jgi:transketolase